MTIYSRNYNQTCTYWAVDSLNEFNEPVFASPVTIACRWHDKKQLIASNEGDEKVSNASVFLAAEVDTKGYLQLGDHTAQSNAHDAGAFEILDVMKTPSLNNSYEVVKALL